MLPARSPRWPGRGDLGLLAAFRQAKTCKWACLVVYPDGPPELIMEGVGTMLLCRDFASPVDPQRADREH
jgi:hypothetical protein